MKRKEGESFEDYKARRSAENKRIKQYLKGTLFYLDPEYRRPYRKPN
jgi:hypothetical protein